MDGNTLTTKTGFKSYDVGLTTSVFNLGSSYMNLKPDLY